MGSTVADVMTTGVVSVTEGIGYKEIVRILLERRISAVPVVGPGGRVVGVVSEEDLLHKEEFKEEDDGLPYWPSLRARLRSRLTGPGMFIGPLHEKARATLASGLMTSPAVTTVPDASVVEAARLMEYHGVKRLPVVDASSHLVGIVARSDLLRVFLQDDEAITCAVEDAVACLLRTVEGGTVIPTVIDGVVTLNGSVAQRSTGYLLTRLVSRVEGVVAVHNKVAWTTDDMMHPYAGL
jgi:CBS-domain-containing membrane protein